MKWLTLELIKQNSRIRGNNEDAILELYGNSAEDQVLDDIGRTYEELMQWQGSVPPKIVHASLMLVDFAYRQKSPADTLNWSVVPLTYEHLIKSYMRLADRKVYDEKPIYSSSDI